VIDLSYWADCGHAIEDYVAQATARVSSSTEALLGAVEGHRRVVGCLHLVLGPERAEAGLSVDPGYRAFALGLVLLWSAFEQARTAGNTAITLRGVRDDMSVLALACRARVSVLVPGRVCQAMHETPPQARRIELGCGSRRARVALAEQEAGKPFEDA
jgi:hypothetical protein